MKHRISAKISYFFKARHRNGHGIHSPFLFRLITEVIENKGNFSAYPLMKDAGENVRNMLKILDMKSYQPQNKQTVIVNSNENKELHRLPERIDRLIFRLVNEFRPKDMAFYGSTFGVTLLAMALADRRIKLDAQVENDHYRSFCRRLAEVYEVNSIQFSEAGIVKAADFVVIQNPLDPEYCQRVLSAILAASDYDGVVIVSGVHTSAEMESVWAKSKSNPVIKVALDLFEIGILICRTGLNKEEFVVRF